MKITNFIITYNDNCLFLISLFLLFSLFMLLIAYESFKNKSIFCEIIFFILFGLIFVFFFNVKNIASKISQKQLTIFYTNEDDKTIKINKTQIIKEILNGNIKEGNKCLEEYKQTFTITNEEYEKLSTYQKTFLENRKNGNVYIME